MTAPNAPVSTPIAIVGMACLFPKADGLGMYWANIQRGTDGIGPVPETHWKVADYFDADPKKPDHTYAQRGGFIEPVAFDPAAHGIAPNALEATDASQLLSLVVASEALKHAGYGHDRAWDRSRTSVVLGVTGTLQLAIPLGARLGHPQWRKALADAGVPADVAEDVVARIADSYVPWQEASFPGLLGNVVAGRVANRLDLGGTNCVVDAACASSLSAVHLASLELATGRAQMVVTGGADAFNDIFMYMCFSKTPALSPTGDSRPYDAQGDGTALGEGVGMVVLKRLDDAERDGDTIWAVLKGVGSASDGRGKAIYAPDDGGQARALTAAYELAGVSPRTVELVEGHGTGTKVGDAIEVTALRQVYGDAAPGEAWCALGSVKSQIGHTKSAAGAAGLIKAALALHHKVLPPTIKVSQPLAKLTDAESPFYLTNQPRPWLGRADHPRRAAVSAFGFGGSNFHAVLEEHRPARRQANWDGLTELVAIGAASVAEVEARLSRYTSAMAWDQLRIAATDDRAAFSAEATHRLAFVVVRGETDVDALVAGLRKRLAEGKAFATPDGASYGVGPAAGLLAAIFPGQGAQYPGMGRDLGCVFPQALGALQVAEAAYGERAYGQRLVDKMVPPTAWDEAAKAAQADALKATDVAQPAIGAMALGAWKVLAGFGVAPAMAGGHSYGELAALCAAGRLDEADFFSLSVTRGRLMAGDGGDRGGMLAVTAGANEVAAWLPEIDAGLVVANKNAPSQVVVAGPTAAVDKAEAAIAARGVRAVRLGVGAAFHSPLVAGAEAAFGEALADVSIGEGRFPVYANTTGAAYPADADAARAMLAGQLARPVEWVAEIEAMYAAGARTFLEVGPGARLGGLVKAILGDRAHAAIAIDGSNGRKSGLGDLARALAALAAAGHEVELSGWQGGEAAVAEARGRKAPRMAVPISGANVRAKRAERPLAAPMNGRNGQGHGAGNGVGHAASGVAAGGPATGALNGAAAGGPSAGASNGAADGRPAGSTGATNGAGAHVNGAAAGRNGHAPGLPSHGHAAGATPTNGAAPPTSAAPPPASSPAIQKVQPVSEQLPVPQPVALPPAVRDEAARAASETLAAWRQMQEQTARLHQAFLEGQQTAQETFRQLVMHQQALLGGAPAAPAAHASTGQASTGPASTAAAFGGLAAQPAAIVSAPAPAAPVHAAPAVPAASVHRPVAPAPAPVASSAAAAVSPAPAAAVRAAAPGAATADGGAAMAALIAVVADKTGYPPETLSPEMALEADLGIDSIKRVEIMSALAERLPGSRPIAADRAASLVTLQDVATALGGAAAAAPAAAPVGASVGASAGLAAASAASGALAAIVAVVADKTGYPAETLDLDMALEADLGIDSIKRVEIMSALAERLPGSAPVAADRLGAAQTLREVAALFGDVGATAPAPAAVAAAGTAPAVGGSAGGLVGGAASGAASGAVDTLIAVIADKTGYPPETLDLDMALEADLGIDSIKRVEILSALAERLPGAAPIRADQAGSLVTLRDVVGALGVASPATGAPAPVAVAAAPAAAGTTLGGTAQGDPAPAPLGGVAEAVTAVVAEKTGYPPETLEPSMALEADLGIDSIKRVEILSALAERLPGAPTLRPDALGALATLADVIAALGGSTAAGAAAAPSNGAPAASAAAHAPSGATPPPAAAPGGPAPASNGVAPPPGAPDASAALAALADAPLADPAEAHGLVCDVPVPLPLGEGETLPAPKAPFGAELWIAGPADAPLQAAIADRLAALGFRATPIDLAAPLPAAPAALAGLVVVGPTGPGPLWTEADEALLKASFRLVAACGPALRAADGAWLATVGRMDGAFGCARADAPYNPAAGALAGLAKTAAREWPEVACQALDVHPAWEDAEAAAAIVAELFLDGPAEIGLGPAGRLGLVLMPAGAAPAGPAPLSPGDLVVVTGGARGVTAEVAVALARAYRPTLALFGRTALPAPEPAWLAAATTEADVKRALAVDAGGSIAPKALEARWREIAAAREVRGTLARLEALGATVAYVAADVRDPAAVAEALDGLRGAHGPVRGLVHGAGVLADKLIADKTPAQFDAVFDTKVAGLRALLGAMAPDEAGLVVLFSSITARLGRVGQADYAMANELLNKAARRLMATRPGCRALAVDWGPWDGGMVTPALKAIFAGEGVGVVPLEAGAAWLAAELGRDRPGLGELVVLGTPPGGPAGGPAGADALKTAFTQSLSLRSHPFLASHVMNGKAVLPVAMIVEWMAHAALHTNPGQVFQGFTDFAVLKGVVLDDEPYRVRLDAGRAAAGETAVRLGGEGRPAPHARATVRLGDAAPVAPTEHWTAEWGGGEGAAAYGRSVQDAYRQVLFHGPEFRGITAVDAVGPEGVIGRTKAARAPAAWIQTPLRDTWIMDPLALDAAFQLMIVWSTEVLGAPCLPCRAASFTQYAPFPADGTVILARITERGAGTAKADIAFLDGVGRLIAELEGAECAFDASLADAFRRNDVAATAP